MNRAREHINTMCLFHFISSLDQYAQVSGQAGWLTGNIHHIRHLVINDLVQCLWMNAVSWWIKDDIIRLIFNGIQHFQNVTGNEFTVVQLVQSGIDFGRLDSSSTISTPTTFFATAAKIWAMVPVPL